MAEHEQGFEPTELPTQRRRDEAREQGQFAFSHELVTALVLLAGAFSLWWGGQTLVHSLHRDLNWQLSMCRLDLSVSDAQSLFSGLLGRGLELIGAVVAGLFVVGLGANLAQAGFHITPESLGPKWEKLNPVSGWGRIASTEGLARGMFAVAKVGLIAAVVWWVLRGRGGRIATLAEGDLGQSVTAAWDLCIRLILTIAVSLVTVGVADYGVHWFRNERAMLMTRQELKQENKEDAGDPLLRSRRRQRAREIANQRRLIEAVTKATVVITNPTHLAVALRYEQGVTSAPVVVAKGRDQFAFQIAVKARRHGIPVVERKPVAQALYKSVKVGQEIPAGLYYAVSEVLAYIYRLRGTAA
ncbi:MAG: EscU/YscU/HrcU family type III secretion system export apparatus switch protein [Planctomycetales bacterium]|nr:EscU/YscU/HrcU family type III secretion system export apparatus switch protein [Planctomycetales bacterium]